MHSRWLLVLVGATALVGFGFVSRAGASEAAEISACVNPAGALRIVEGQQGCRPGESRLKWNVQVANGELVRSVAPVTIGTGNTTPLFTSGPFTVTGTCAAGQNSADVAGTLFISTTEDHSAFANTFPFVGFNNTDNQVNPNFDSAAGPQRLAGVTANQAANFKSVAFSAIGFTSGAQLNSQLWVRALSETGGLTCSFGGIYVGF